MRNWIDLFEGKIIRTTNDTGHHFTIFENPMPAQLRALQSQTSYELKAVLSPDGNTTYVWNAYYAHHYEALGLVYGLTYDQLFPDGFENDMYSPEEFHKWATYFIIDGPKLSTEDAVETLHRLCSSRAVARMLGGDPKAFLYDPSQLET